MVGNEYASWGQPCPTSQGAGPPSEPKISGTSYVRVHTVREMTTEFCMAIQLDVWKIFTGSTTNADARSVCCS